jgi:hypothetical protein
MLIAIFDDRVDPALTDHFPGHDVTIIRTGFMTASEFVEQARGARLLDLGTARAKHL